MDCLEVESFDRILEAVCADPLREIDWIEMLAQLEYVGCRKIVRAVAFERVNQDVLQHIMEEASHAFLLKALATRLRGGSAEWTGSTLGSLGWHYFQSLDRQVSELQGGQFHYPAVSWIVEQRVLTIYPLYLKTTRNADVGRVLRRILAQEKRHSEQFGHEAFDETFKARAIEIEASLWTEFAAAVRGWLEGLAQVKTAAPIPGQPRLSKQSPNRTMSV